MLGVEPGAERGHLGLPLVPGFLHDPWDLGVGDKALPPLLIPVEDHPHLVVLVGIAEDLRTLDPVVASFVRTLGGEDLKQYVRS